MRYYTKDEKKYVSVTSILSEMYPFNREGFEKWCNSAGWDADVLLGISQTMGSKVSEWLDNKCRGLSYLDSPAIGTFEKGLLQGVESFSKEFEILETEVAVYNDDLRYAGTLDGIIMYKGVKTLADWKTYGAYSGVYKRSSDKIKKVRLQTSLYNDCLEERLPQIVVVFKVDGTYEIEEMKYDDKALVWWEERMGEYLT